MENITQKSIMHKCIVLFYYLICDKKIFYHVSLERDFFIQKIQRKGELHGRWWQSNYKN